MGFIVAGTIRPVNTRLGACSKTADAVQMHQHFTDPHKH
jgi:hypothetical protein